MAAAPRLLNLSVYAPALEGDDRRPLAIVHGMERALPDLRLRWTLSEKEELIALPHRDEWVATHRADGGFPFLCNDDESRPVTLTGWENPSGLAAGGPPRFEVHATLPQDPGGLTAAGAVLEAIGEGARAVWGQLSPSGYGEVVSQQFRRPGDAPHVSPHGLPWLKLPRYNPAPELPHYLGWLNYWSDASARAIGFPDPARDAELLSRARRTETGGWVVQLTDAPLDFDNPTHLDALLRAYGRFPKIGGRSAT
ncbi:DUF5953 family protein [Pyxidicoccus xibeiensis]|uniref:DUF5953 family protein n=1 Tax=Pyxidicoccus xibeiensis TaxID=2906759 RepID=UPI0020A7A38D|nr:DUF5953 family protein [Pyxidicoccus xibeiensis]MCP3143542.1 DUF5953 family protein [Pyxidicoccus xibeiensis]